MTDNFWNILTLVGWVITIALVLKTYSKMEKMIMNQAQLNETVAGMKTSVEKVVETTESLRTDIQTEIEQVKQFIENHPDLDTSELESVATNLKTAADGLGTVSVNVGTIFPDVPEVEETDTETETDTKSESGIEPV